MENIPLRGIQTSEFTIAANQMMRVSGPGNFFRCLEASSDFVVSFNNGGKSVFKGGYAYEASSGEVFTSVEVFNENAVDLVVTLAWGFGNLKDGNLSVSSDLNVAASPNLSTTPDVTVPTATTALVIAANTGRKEVAISNLFDNTDIVRYGDVNTGASRGTPLAPGATVYLQTTAAIYVYNPATTDQIIAVSEV